jgi:hypothetical protein
MRRLFETAASLWFIVFAENPDCRRKSPDTPLKIGVFIGRGEIELMWDSSENSRDIFIRGGEVPFMNYCWRIPIDNISIS